MNRHPPRAPKAKRASAAQRNRRVGQHVGGRSGHSRHVTAAGDNIFRDLGFPPDKAENLRLRADLMMALRQIIDGLPQSDAACMLGVSQPRISHLTRGKIGMFTIDTLVNMLGHAGGGLRVTIKRPKRSAA
jgi:predicted XRE-type DNA-binding protein